MKIRTCAALLIALLTISLLAGCSARAAEEKLEAAEAAVEQQLDVVEEAVENAVMQAVLPEPTVPAAPAVPVEAAAPAVTEAAVRLSPEEAQSIALEHAGFAADQVKFLYTEYEIDDRIPQYDVQFYQGRWEYEYEIHAEAGTILSFEMDD